MRVRDRHLALIGNRHLENQIREILLTHFPDAAAVPDAEMARSIRRQISQAERYGFITHQDIATYVISAWLLGEDFDTSFPAAQRILMGQEDAEERSTQLAIWTTAIFEALEQ